MREASKRLPGDTGTPGVGNGRPDQTRDHSLENVKDCLAGIQNIQNAPGGLRSAFRDFRSWVTRLVQAFVGLRTNPHPAEPGFLPCVDSRQGRVTGSECEY